MNIMNCWKNQHNNYCPSKLTNWLGTISRIFSSVASNINENIKKKVNNKKNTTTPLFSCIAIRTNQIVQCYNNELRYHNHIRYVYFDLDSLLRMAWHRKDTLLIRIINNRGKEIVRFNIDLERVNAKDTIINGIITNEILVKGEKGHLMIRIPATCDKGGKVVFIYNRNEI